MVNDLIELDKSSEFKFQVVVAASLSAADSKRKKHIDRVVLKDPTDAIKQNKKYYEKAARLLSYDFIDTNQNGGIFIPFMAREIENGFFIEMEKMEEMEDTKDALNNICYAIDFRVRHKSGFGEDLLKMQCRALEEENRLLKKEVQELIELVDQVEIIKEAFRIPFDAIADLVISFDKEGNVLVVNEASTEWFGQTPHNIVRRKYKTILKQNVPDMIKQVLETNQSVIIEENIDNRILQITYIPMLNRKNGKTEVVMMAQDITHRKKAEAERLEKGRIEGVVVMGGTVKHILNSSLSAIMGFAQLALSSYEWPKETMIKYLKLIERTAQRMKREINQIAGQKQFKTTTYLNIPGTKDCREIIELEPESESENL